MKLAISITALSFLLCNLHAQRHEVKAELFPAFNNNFWLHYEYGINKRMGVELIIGNIEDIRFVSYRPTSPTTIDSTFNFKSGREYDIGISGKYYFFPKKGRDRDKLYLGPTASIRWKTKYEQAYIDEYKNRFGREPYTLDFPTHFNVGIVLGYKWLIKKRWVIEPMYRTWYEVYISENKYSPARPQHAQDASVHLKLGYRF